MFIHRSTWSVSLVTSHLLHFFNDRFKSRQTPVKSSEELEIERVRREKEEMASLKKQNEVGLRSITSGNSARKERKPPTLPSGTSANKQHAMNTRADAQVKLCVCVICWWGRETTVISTYYIHVLGQPSTSVFVSIQSLLYLNHFYIYISIVFQLSLHRSIFAGEG